MIAALLSASFDICPLALALVTRLDRVFGSRWKSKGVLLEQREDTDEEDDQGSFEVEHGFSRGQLPRILSTRDESF